MLGPVLARVTNGDYQGLYMGIPAGWCSQRKGKCFSPRQIPRGTLVLTASSLWDRVPDTAAGLMPAAVTPESHGLRGEALVAQNKMQTEAWSPEEVWGGKKARCQCSWQTQCGVTRACFSVANPLCSQAA